LDVNAGIFTVKYTILAESKVDGGLTTLEEVHRLRYLFPSEIAFLATQKGFRMERSEQFLTGTAPSSDSWGVAYLLRKSEQRET
jgi:hypothetical protein